MMSVSRREFLGSTLAATAAMGGTRRLASASTDERVYPYLGRIDEAADHHIIEPGLTVERIETFTREPFSVVRITASDGTEGYGQISTYDADLSATVLHRKLARHVLGQDASRIDALVDRCIEANHKFPWSFVCRALTGIDTALWDLYGKVKGQPVCELLGGTRRPILAYGSSMRRDISPDEEAARVATLRDRYGFEAFKVRVGSEQGRNQDAAPGRTEALIPAVRKAAGGDVRLLVDGNSCYTPPKAIEVGRLLEQHDYTFFEEPCPWWELEWTAEVAAALDIPVAGGEQDNDLAQWRRMIQMRAVDIVQPDICYVGGVARTLRVARMAEQAGTRVVPHSANLSLVTLFSLHVLAAIPNAGPFVEYTIEWDTPVNAAFYHPRLEVKDGRVPISGEPGWGVEIDRTFLESADYQKSERDTAG